MGEILVDLIKKTCVVYIENIVGFFLTNIMSGAKSAGMKLWRISRRDIFMAL